MSQPHPEPMAQVLVLTGPSGAGKSRLARRLHHEHGWPVLQLDDFYRELGDPALRVTSLGIPDWDDVTSWDLHRALAALTALCTTGSARTPVYDISRSAAIGHRDVALDGHRVVVAEGIFAAHVIAPLRERGMLAAAWCISGGPWVTFTRRLGRDLAERRKPPLTLWRRGHALRRAERELVDAHAALGAQPMTAQQAEVRSHGLPTARRHRALGGRR